MKKKLINTKIALAMQENLESFTDQEGHTLWTQLTSFLSEEFPEERITMNRIRSIRRSYLNGTYDNTIKKIERAEPPKISAVPPSERKVQTTMKRAGSTAEGNIMISSAINPVDLDEAEIVRLFKLDTKKWECVSFTTKAWQTAMRDKDKNPIQPTNWSVSAKFKLRHDLKFDKEDLQWLFDTAREASDHVRGKVRKNIPLALTSNNVYIPSIYDLHLGKLSWAGETGENFDLKVGYNRALRVFKSLTDRALAGEGFDSTILVIGNDFFQYDNDKLETNGGTPQDTDTRPMKLFKKGVDLLRDMINYVAEIAPVDVIWVPGNHDQMMSFYAFETLRGYYDKDPNVTIDQDMKRRHYRLIGRNLIGFTHGDKVKDLAGVMQHEAKAMWGKSDYAEWNLGHLHREIVKEDKGVVLRTQNSLSGTDAWHYSKGFIGSRIAAQASIFKRSHIGPYTILYEAVDITTEPDQK